MATLTIKDFKEGLDVRRSPLTAVGGSLQILDNGVITPGGEIQKRMAFIKVMSLPAGQTKGLAGTNTGGVGTEQLFVFGIGSGANRALGTVGANGTIPVFEALLAAPDDGGALADVSASVEYGAQDFFVAGTTSTGAVTTERNWWKGTLVPEMVGHSPITSGQKMYRVAGSVLYFSGVGDPSVTEFYLDPPADTEPNTTNPGAGFIDTALIDSDSKFLVGMQAYYQQVAIFSRRVCLLYTLDPDPANNDLQQVLKIGTVASQSIVQFGTGDVLFLSDSGIRSLRAINYTLAAGVTDVGSPIDKLIQAAILAAETTAEVAEAIIEPISGRYWIAIGSIIYVLSYWPSADISAWSTFSMPFNVDHMTVAGNRVFLRSGDDIYLYGGQDGATYDDSTITVTTPFMSADAPTVQKKFRNVDVMAQGLWKVELGAETGNLNFYETAMVVDGDTYSMLNIPWSGKGTHVSMRFTCSDAAPVLLGAAHVSYSSAEEK